MPDPNHPHYPPLLPRGALLASGSTRLVAFQEEVRVHLTRQLNPDGYHRTGISRALLAVCNYNLIQYADEQDRQQVVDELMAMGGRQLKALGNAFTMAIRECE